MNQHAPFPYIDPWPDLGPLRLTHEQRRAAHPAERPPQAWNTLQPAHRAMLGGLALHVLDVHGPYAQARARFIHVRLQEAFGAILREDEKVGGHGHDLTGYFVRDAEQRAEWAKLDWKVRNQMFADQLLGELLEALGAGGDLEETLLARRAAIDTQLARLAKVRPAKAKGAA